MDIDNYNQMQQRIGYAKQDMTDALHQIMRRHDLSNTETTSILAQLLKEWSHYSLCDLQNLQEDLERKS